LGQKTSKAKWFFSDFKAGENTIVEVKTTFKVFADKTVGRDSYIMDNPELHDVGPFTDNPVAQSMIQDLTTLFKYHNNPKREFEAVMFELPGATSNVFKNMNDLVNKAIKPIKAPVIINPVIEGTVE
jgi:hypothetical protein